MSDSPAPVAGYLGALADPTDEALQLAASGLTEDAVRLSPVGGTARGRAAVVGALTNPWIAGLLAQAELSEPAVAGETVTVTARSPQGAINPSLEFAFTLDGDGRIATVKERLLQGAPLEPQPLELTEEMKADVNGA